ncbi:MAG: response regulator, partial [Desulfobulbaceae bacterium]|nr:response regulator [Desulfobulbaceae bacterium]
MTDSKQQQAEKERLEALVEKLRLENRVLREKAKQADSANKAKSDFLAMISHEIRTPMNGVIGIGELLLGTELESRQKHFAELILISARNLLTLINSLLDFSKIEADKMELESEEFDLKALLGEIMALYSVSGQQHGLDIQADIDSTLADTYSGDAYRLRQILVNLLGNAVKFTEHGGVSLKVLRESRDEKGDLLRFEIIDSGPGIPADKLDKLFIAFSQLDSSSSRRYCGTGLGLSICRKLVELMGGDIGVDSVPDRGSTFWFTLILPLTDRSDQEKGAANDHSGETSQQEQQGAPNRPRQLGFVPDILIVDDDSTNRTLMKEVFGKTGALINTAVHGREAVSRCEEKIFDLIFMDCRMPVMDGFEATSAVRKYEQADNRKPSVIIALTADATTATQKRCRDVGMDDYLIKPLDFDKLQQV